MWFGLDREKAICAIPFRSVTGFIKQMTEERTGCSWVYLKVSISAKWSFILKIRIPFSLLFPGNSTAIAASAVFIKPLMREKHGQKFYSPMILPVVPILF